MNTTIVSITKIDDDMPIYKIITSEGHKCLYRNSDEPIIYVPDCINNNNMKCRIFRLLVRHVIDSGKRIISHNISTDIRSTISYHIDIINVELRYYLHSKRINMISANGCGVDDNYVYEPILKLQREYDIRWKISKCQLI